jgi:hypothetical protein
MTFGSSSFAPTLGRPFAGGFRPAAPQGFSPLTHFGSALKLWLDASDGSTLYDADTGGALVTTAAKVGRWEDKSGNARHLVQSNTNRQLTLALNQFNGRNALRLTQTTDNAAAGDANDAKAMYSNGTWTVQDVLRSGNTAVTDSCLIAMVVQLDSYSNGARVLFENNAGNFKFRKINTGANPQTSLEASSNTSPNTSGGVTVAHGAIGIATFRKLAGVSHNVSWNGGTEVSAAITAAIGGTWSDLFWLGGAPATFKHKMYVCEMLSLVGVEPSAADRNLLGHYLADRWGGSWTDQS